MLCLSTLLACTLAFAPRESRGDSAKTPRLFDNDSTLEVVLRLPWETIVTDEFFFQGGYPSHIEVNEGKGHSVSLPVMTERRGWSRQVICRYPPIKLRFAKNDVKGTLFEGQKSLKLVTHCEKNAAFEQYQVLESLAYRMYNLISDFSFRVRPLSVTYIDTETGKSDGPRFAFLIEDASEVTGRTGQKKLQMAEVSPDRMESLEASKLWLFQFMIGNSAWSLEHKEDEQECCDNLKLIGQDPESGPVYAIPNDFDSSGLVNARYSKSAKKPNTAALPKRQYLGFCVHNSTLNEARDLYLDRQKDILSLVENNKYLHEDVKKQTVVFLEQYFGVLSDPEQFKNQVLSNCRN